jgi:hypothetical protein
LDTAEELPVRYCGEFGFDEKRVCTLGVMLNAMISGEASPRQHLLQNYLFSGALLNSWIL